MRENFLCFQNRIYTRNALKWLIERYLILSYRKKKNHTYKIGTLRKYQKVFSHSILISICISSFENLQLASRVVSSGPEVGIDGSTAVPIVGAQGGERAKGERKRGMNL